MVKRATLQAQSQPRGSIAQPGTVKVTNTFELFCVWYNLPYSCSHGGKTLDAAKVLEEVARQVSVCQKCSLHHSRKLSVPGEGPVNAEIMCIGEGPGFYENEQGRPFVGQAGKFLDELLASAGLRREEVFITNVVKCRPPSNRDPLPEELTACSEYLDRQIEALNPRIIVTLGRFSMARYLVNAMYHPAAALHQPSLKKTIEEDFKRLPAILKQARQTLTNQQNDPGGDKEEKPSPEKPADDDAVQLSLF
jgi:uracil-DNA glycosylase